MKLVYEHVYLEALKDSAQAVARTHAGVRVGPCVILRKYGSVEEGTDPNGDPLYLQQVIETVLAPEENGS